jgi:hypothetical protein
MVIIILPQHAGTWPDGEPQSVRDAADGIPPQEPYEVYLVMYGTATLSEPIAAYADRDIARMHADIYNQMYVKCGHPECRAHVEDITFYPAGSAPIPVIS